MGKRKINPNQQLNQAFASLFHSFGEQLADSINQRLAQRRIALQNQASLRIEGAFTCCQSLANPEGAGMADVRPKLVSGIAR